jgi:7-cyano-7-deazaguanine synthase
MQNQRHAMVLLSGGMDSAACVHYYISLGYSVDALHVNYGQRASGMESQSALQIADRYGICLRSISFDSSLKYGPGVIPGRNAFLLLAALLACPGFRGIISMGIHAGTPYYDCGDRFVRALRVIVSEYTDGETVLDFPFLRWTKSMIFDYCTSSGVPLSLCYSCERGSTIPCGTCSSCKDMEALHALSGIRSETQ